MTYRLLNTENRPVDMSRERVVQKLVIEKLVIVLTKILTDINFRLLLIHILESKT